MSPRSVSSREQAFRMITEICGTVVAPFSPGVVLMGKRDFHPLSANFLLPHWLPSHGVLLTGRRRSPYLRV